MHIISKVVIAAALCAVAPDSSAYSRDASERFVEQLSVSYLREWSTDGQRSVSRVGELYAPRVLFYGRQLDRTQLRSEKSRFIERWPVRNYVLRPGTVRVSCASRASCFLTDTRLAS